VPVVALRGKRHALARGDIDTGGSRRVGASVGLVDRLVRKLGKTILSEYRNPPVPEDPRRDVRRLPRGASRGLAGGVLSPFLRPEQSIDLRSSDPSISFETLPRLQDQRQLLAAFSRLGCESPYFLMHEGRASASTVIEGRTLINFSSYDYLGFNQHPEVHQAAQEAINRFGVSPSASRLVAGEREPHRRLERALAEHYNQDACLSFVSGHATNVSVIGTIMGPGDLILFDTLSHNSIVIGARLARAKVRVFPHNDFDALDEALQRRRNLYRRVLIVAEGLYSMDGDVCDLPRLLEIKERYGAWLMIDDAHGLGVLGDRGLGSFERFGVDPRRVDVWMGTLSKTLAASGGFVAGPSTLIEYLRHNAGGFVYSVALAPAFAAAALAAHQLLLQSHNKVQRLRRNAKLFNRLARGHGLDVGFSVGEAIMPIIIGDSLQAVVVGSNLLRRGVNVQPIIYPAVADGEARLRFFVSSEHSSRDIETALSCVAEEIRTVQRDVPPLGGPSERRLG
jgi:8-amino-7-oxononanoate synthase